MKGDVRILCALMAAGLSFLGIAGASGAAKDDAAANCETLENDRFVLSVNPVGGRLMRFYSKAIGEELTDVGTFSEEDWAIRASHEFLIGKPYALRCRKENGELDILATANATGGGIDFLKIEKRFRSSPDSTSLRIDYRITNTPEAMSERIYSILFHAILGIAGKDVNCFYPVTDGIEKVPQKGSGKEHWGYYPARGWIAAATEEGKGLAVTMPFRDLRTFYSWFSPASLPTLEWRMTPVALGCGESYDVATEVIPFAGLRNVSGAGGGLVGELADGSCRVVSARAGTVTARAGGKAVELVFANPGDLREFATDAAFVELERDGKAVCRLDAMPKDGKTPLAPLEAPRVSPVKPIDLLCYTNFNATAESAWAKPLAGGAVRAAFVTGQGNQIEVGLLAARLDLDYRVIGGEGARNFRGFTNPQYSYGDHFSVAGTSDLQGEICRALEWKSDVIVLGGAPFDGLPEKARKTIESRVRAGAGLVLIGQDRSIPAFGLELQPKAKMKPLVPQAVGDAFAGVPFDLLGREPVHPVATNGAVHASCGDRAYVSETRCGKGRVVNLAYFAAPDHVAPIYGITPGLLDFYPDRVAPAELYFSLVAKAILKAAGRDLPLRFAGATVGATGARIGADVSAAGTYSCAWCVKNAFRETLARGSADVTLAKGAGEIALPAELAAYGGPLSYELVVRKDGVVQNWGAWSFRLPPKAEIAALDFDANFHAEGEPIALTVRTTSAADGLALRLSLVDACGRTVDAKTVAASGTATETLVARNALPMRSYTAVAELVDAGRVVSKRRLDLVVRPDRAKIAWDDFEAGTWGNAETRQYLWPFVADTYRRYGIRTVCGNAYSLRYGFATRYDFSSMISHYAGLQRSMEPAEYTKTGDKTKLVRTPCISSPAYFEGTAKHIDSYKKVLDDYTFRIHGFGDEQSLTGFGGAAVDYCFSTNCLREFRAFVRARYGTLERLNAEWETDFADWDAVMPFTRQEVWDAKLRHVAGWADHREFMDDRVTNSLAFSVNRLRAAAPHLRFSISGTQSAAAYGGMDWWKIMHVLDTTMDYMTEGQTDMRRAYRPDGRFMPWAWGYGSRGPGAVNAVWRVPFIGGHGLIGFWARSQFRPDFQPSLGLADAQPHVLRLVHGVGRHMMDNLVFPREVALLHSQASFRCAFIEDRRKEQDAVLARYRTMLRNLGCAWDYVSYDQLAEGVVAARGYKTLLLVDAVAMGDAEIAGVRDFAAKGGSVIADGMPATHTWNCRRRDASPLAGIFSGRNVLFPREADAAVERPRLAAALERAGIPTARFAVTEPDGTPIPDAEIFYRTDRAGNPFFGILSSDLKTRKVRYRFPREGLVFDLVDGKGYGKVSSVEAGWGQGVVHAFVVLDEPTGVGIASVEGAKVSFDCGSAVDTVLRVTVRRPDGSAADCYSKNVLARGGKASYELPFALSDPAGKWRVTATNVLSGEAASCTVER